MRGLTAEEREALSAAVIEADPINDEVVSPDRAVIFDRLVQLGRAVLLTHVVDRLEWEEWRSTELGNLALRVCPVDE